jgi:hypothetical protein
MNKWLGGVVACGLAGLTAVGFAPPGGAQEPPEPTEVLLEATVSPEVAEPGETITVTSVEPCSLNEGFEESGTLSWVWFSEEDFESFDFGDVPLNADGSWEVTFAAPDISGGFFFSAGCFPDGWEEEDAFCFSESEEPVEPAEDLTAATSDDETPPSTEPPTTEPPAKPPFNCVFEFYDTGFEVVGGQPPTTTPPGQPTPPPPAIPVPGQPSTTG